MASNVFAVAAHNMKNNNAKLGCLQLVMRNTISSSSHKDHTQNDGMTQEPRMRMRMSIDTMMPSFGYDPLSLGVPCNNSVRYDPVRQDERTTKLLSQASFPSDSSFSKFDDSAFDDSAWESMDKDIDDAIEREVNENEEYFDIETGLMNFSFAGETKSWLDTPHMQGQGKEQEQRQEQGQEQEQVIPSPLDPKIEVNSKEIQSQDAWNAWNVSNAWNASNVSMDKNKNNNYTHTTLGQPIDQPIKQIFPFVSSYMNFTNFKTSPVMNHGIVW